MGRGRELVAFLKEPMLQHLDWEVLRVVLNVFFVSRMLLPRHNELVEVVGDGFLEGYEYKLS